MKAELINISELTVNPNNPRIIKDEKFDKLVQSIKEFPEMLKYRPIVVDENNVILGGNMRFKACKAAKLKQVHVIKASELTEAQKREFIIKDNVSGGEWDWAMLQTEWDTEQLDAWGLDVPDFEPEQNLEAVEDDYEIPDEIQTDIVLGDLFEIGEHRLLCGDSTDSDAVAKLMDGQKADMVFTDPPYGIGYESKGRKIQNDERRDDFEEFLLNVFTTMDLFIKEGCPIYAASPIGLEQSKYVNAWLWKYQSAIVWKKPSLNLSRFDYHPIHEIIHYGWKEGAAHKWYGDRKQTSVFEFEKTKNNKEHPTMKPIGLVEYFMNNSSVKKDIIIDVFLGSGSTMVAAHQLKRKCYGMELDPKYCQVIIDRMIKLDPTLRIKRNGQPYKTDEIQTYGISA
jgi:site-specific DNA-methyltransferase (adenine-specific)